MTNNAFSKIFDAVDQAPVNRPQKKETPREEHTSSSSRGRPRGKKSDPNFVSAIAYIRKSTHMRVKRLLLEQEEQGYKQEFSELVQELLETWIEIQSGENPDILLSRFSDIQK